MKRLLVIGLLLTTASVLGCGGDGESTSVMDSADQAAINEYERLVAEQDSAVDAAPPNEDPSPE